MDVYPNTNLHLIHSDKSFGSYNARLHFGGGCGGSLVRREMADKSYLVISFLRTSENTSQRRTQPPTPITSSYPGSSTGGPDLPSFASLTSTVPLGEPYYLATRPPGAGQSNFAYSPPSHLGQGRMEPLQSHYSRPVTATMGYDSGSRPRSGPIGGTSPQQGFRRASYGREEEMRAEERRYYGGGGESRQ
jgi:hypothetical protein